MSTNICFTDEKIIFPENSFLIAGISYNQNNLENINYDSEFDMKLDPKNKYDINATKILFNDKLLGYVPRAINNEEFIKNNINNKLKIINMKREKVGMNMGIRVIPKNLYHDNMINYKNT